MSVTNNTQEFFVYFNSMELFDIEKMKDLITSSVIQFSGVMNRTKLSLFQNLVQLTIHTCSYHGGIPLSVRQLTLQNSLNIGIELNERKLKILKVLNCQGYLCCNDTKISSAELVKSNLNVFVTNTSFKLLILRFYNISRFHFKDLVINKISVSDIYGENGDFNEQFQSQFDYIIDESELTKSIHLNQQLVDSIGIYEHSVFAHSRANPIKLKLYFNGTIRQDELDRYSTVRELWIEKAQFCGNVRKLLVFTARRSSVCKYCFGLSPELQQVVLFQLSDSTLKFEGNNINILVIQQCHDTIFFLKNALVRLVEICELPIQSLRFYNNNSEIKQFSIFDCDEARGYEGDFATEIVQEYEDFRAQQLQQMLASESKIK